VTVTNAGTQNLQPPILNRLKTNVVPKLLEKVSSLSNVVAVSTVDGIKFSGINIGANNLSVTLIGQPTVSNTTTAGTTRTLIMRRYQLRFLYLNYLSIISLK
jgi:hypothetical protein